MAVTTPAGHVVADEHGMRLEFVRLVDAPVDRVWSVLTDSEQLGRWFGTWSGDPATGFVMLRFNESPEDAYAETVTVVECAPRRRLAVVVPGPEGAWPLNVELQTRGDGGTFLLFTQRLAEPYDASSIGPGWHFYLDRMEAVLADEPLPAGWEDYFPALAYRYGLPA